MKKIILLIIFCTLMMSVAACTSESSGTASSPMTSGENTSDSTPTTESSSAPQSTAALPPMATPDPNKKSTLVFAMYAYDPYLEDATKAYEQKHPNIKIDFQYVAKEFDPAGTLVEKFNTKTNADFLRGKGPDLVVMDDLPETKYVGNKLLVNLGEMMDSDPSFQKEQYYQNIISNIKEKDGGVYTMPLSFYLSGLIGDEEALDKSGVAFDDKSWTWDQFSKTMKNLPPTDKYNFPYFAKTEQNLLYEMVNANFSQLVDKVNKKAYFDTDRFIKLMEQIKTMEADKTLTLDPKNYEKVYFQQGDLYSLSNFLDYLENSKISKLKLYELPKAEGQQPGGYFSTFLNIGINANTSLKPEAWDFLKFLMSGEGSLTDKELEGNLGWYNSLPISKTVFEARAAETMKDGKLKQEDLQQIEAFISNAKTPKTRMPGEIEIIFFKEVPAFFSGQKSAQVVADTIQNKAMTYLNE
ncbi:extracellular solute-binding protein [Paenibacillus psychroresistens]|uniref:Extracellular solute-binding protein n=1 Tax=Paenibacillus psychroresistens TaxID=1778678 RepID=A0A6B8RQF9_9BACL|nr:extracellular solute-binding protein [Paenibacillus psychroresistens]QGQ97626.1 extracellular solute-binding protein [Paenibacillus psychroresistens]